MFYLPQDIQDKLDELRGAFSDLRKTYGVLSENYRKRNVSELTESEAVAYAEARMPATCNVLAYVLQKFFDISEKTNNRNGISTILDVGAGTGALKIVLDTFSARYSTNQVEYFGIEKSEAMRNVFRQLVGNSSELYPQDFSKFHSEKKYDAVFASYSLNEMNDAEAALKKIFSIAASYIFIIDPGTPVGYQNILKAKAVAASNGWNTWLPCAMSECPMKNRDWCHFSVRVPRTKQHINLKAGSLSYEDEKFCYVIFSKNPMPSRGDIIIKKPIKKRGHTIFDVCSKDGLRRVILTNKNLEEKLQWGDEICES